MRSIIQAMNRQLSAGSDLVLVTVTAASGAVPRGAGARMLVNENGRLCGTIGGGAVEHRAIQMAQTVLKEKSSCQHDFTLNRDDVENLGMICGGAVQVFFHYLPCSDKQVTDLSKEAEGYFSRQENLWLLSDLSGGGALSLQTPDHCHPWLKSSFDRHPKRIVHDGRDYFLEQISFSSRVYIMGGGHVAQELVPILTHVGFHCVVMDDRPEFTDPALFPAASQVLMIDFSRIYDYISISDQDYVCVMTRGHAYDTLVQAQVLQSDACYIGVIGSASKAAGVRKALIETHCFTDADVDRIITPIGLKISAETPAEIAVSIAAQLIEVRAKQP